MSPYGLGVQEWVMCACYDHEGLLSLDIWRHEIALLDEIKMALS